MIYEREKEGTNPNMNLESGEIFWGETGVGVLQSDYEKTEEVLILNVYEDIYDSYDDDGDGYDENAWITILPDYNGDYSPPSGLSDRDTNWPVDRSKSF